MQPWITTFTGKHVNPLQMREEDICIEDVAHHLACQTRWVGAAKAPIYTAQHCWFVSQYVRDETPIIQLQALLHEIPEAYLGDMSKWVKEHELLSGYRSIEDHIWAVGCRVFCLPLELHSSIVEADRVMAGVEAYFAMHPDCKTPTVSGYEATPQRLQKIGFWTFWTWQKAEQLFITRYVQLTEQIERAAHIQ